MARRYRRGVIAVNETFSVVDEGDGWLVLNKGAPLIVHPANDCCDEPSLLSGVEELLAYDLINGAKLSIINRLDRETSGIVLMATRKPVARELARAMERREISKVYEAVVWGWPEWDELTVDEPILRQGDVMGSRIYVKQMVHEGGKASYTHLKVLKRMIVRGEKMSHLEILPRTGRMHQIRVHCAHVGHSIVGDKIYGLSEDVYLEFIQTGMNEKMLNSLVMERHALHATVMEVEVGGEMNKWRAQLSPDIVELLKSGKEFEI